MGSTDVAQALRSRWWLPLLGIVLGLLAALGVTHEIPKVYSSTTQLFVGTTGTTDVASAYAGGLFTEQRVESYVELLRGERLSAEVIEQLGLNLRPQQLASRVNARALPNTVILEVTLTDESPRRAQALADAYGQQFIRDATALETSPTKTTPTIQVSMIEAPEVPTEPTTPDVTRNGALGIVLGVLLGAAAAVGLAAAERSVRSPRKIEALTGAAVVGGVLEDVPVRPADATPAHGPVRADPALWGAVGRLTRDDTRVVLVTSPIGGEGRSTVAVRLAATLASSGRRVVLVDADSAGAGVSRSFGLIEEPGLSEVLAGRAETTAVASSSDVILHVLTSGVAPSEGTDPLESSRWGALIAALNSAYDHVVVDFPAMASGAALAGIGHEVDGALLVVRAGVTDRADLAAAAVGLDESGVDLLGTVINRLSVQAAARHGLAYQYHPDRQSSVSTRTSAGLAVAPAGRGATPRAVPVVPVEVS